MLLLVQQYSRMLRSVQVRCVCQVVSVMPQTLMTHSQPSGRLKRRWDCSQALCR
jgi:hypothetical protein